MVSVVALLTGSRRTSVRVSTPFSSLAVLALASISVGSSHARCTLRGAPSTLCTCTTWPSILIESCSRARPGTSSCKVVAFSSCVTVQPAAGAAAGCASAPIRKRCSARSAERGAWGQAARQITRAKIMGSSYTLRGSRRGRRMHGRCVWPRAFQGKNHMNKLRGRCLKTGVATSRRGALVLAACLMGVAALPAAWAQAGGVEQASGAAAASVPTQARPIKVALIESLSGTFANTGEAVYRNVFWAMERVNARGGVQLPASSGGPRPLALERYDSKGQNEEALSALRAAIDDGAQVILQGNSSATAAVLIEAINKHNEREPNKRVIFLNYSAVDPILTNEKCSFWHFRFDAHADMRMAALMDVMREDKSLKSVYLIGQDYSFGQAVLREAKKQLAAQRPDVAVVGDELHPVGRVKDFAPYAVKIKTSGAQAVVTGNWGNDLTLLVKAAREVGYEGSFYTFYGNALGAPAAMGDAGIGKVVAVADWLPNVPGAQSEAFYQSFRARFPKPQDDYVHMRIQLMVEALAQSIERAGSTDAAAIARQMENAQVQLSGQGGSMRAADHQFQQALVVGVMDKKGAPGVKFDVEGSGYGFRVVRQIPAAKAQQPHSCNMQRY